MPETANYTIVACGASARNGSYNQAGRGACLSGVFELTKGTKIKILVGQMSYQAHEGSGGGGGTFVVKYPGFKSDILIIAGGGSGAAGNNPHDNGNDATLTSGYGLGGSAKCNHSNEKGAGGGSFL